MRPAYEVLAYPNSNRPDLMASVSDGAVLAQPLLSLHATNRQKVVIGSGSSAGVAKRFGGGALTLSDGGSFGGTELPISQGAKGRAADKAS